LNHNPVGFRISGLCPKKFILFSGGGHFPGEKICLLLVETTGENSLRSGQLRLGKNGSGGKRSAWECRCGARPHRWGCSKLARTEGEFRRTLDPARLTASREDAREVGKGTLADGCAGLSFDSGWNSGKAGSGASFSYGRSGGGGSSTLERPKEGPFRFIFKIGDGGTGPFQVGKRACQILRSLDAAFLWEQGDG